MAAHERRQTILQELGMAQGPLAGGKLAKQLGVSRQIIVGDIAVLRASGHDIVSTARGYVMTTSSSSAALAAAQDTSEAPATGPASQAVSSPGHEPRSSRDHHGWPTRTIKVRHTVEQTSDELFTILENGGVLIDVSVSHRVYGHLSARLDIETRADALRFLNGMESGKSAPLLTVTSGYHYHTIAAPTDATLDRIERALDSKGYLAPLLPYEREQRRA